MCGRPARSGRPAWRRSTSERDRRLTKTIYDVARHAGVSVATVSRIINGRKVREDLVERVRASISVLGYHPSRTAQRLRTSTSHLWALIVPDFENAFFTRLARGLEQVCRSRDSVVFIGSSDDDPAKESQYLQVALAERVGGVVIAPCSDVPDLRDLSDAGIPVVIVDRAISQDGYDTVLTDNLAGGGLAARHLRATGRKAPLCIVGPPNPTSQARLDGFLAEAGGPPRLEISTIGHGNNRADSGYAVMRRAIEEGVAFDSLFVTNNLMTIGAIKALDEMSVGRKDEIGIIGFDLDQVPLLTGEQITSVRQDPFEMGRIAGERILLRHRNHAIARCAIELMPTLGPVHWEQGAAVIGITAGSSLRSRRGWRR